eukprot:scaffold7202_cov403-Prasinococcus_capsulatus_cf.AAC.3
MGRLCTIAVKLGSQELVSAAAPVAAHLLALFRHAPQCGLDGLHTIAVIPCGQRPHDASSHPSHKLRAFCCGVGSAVSLSGDAHCASLCGRPPILPAPASGLRPPHHVVELCCCCACIRDVGARYLALCASLGAATLLAGTPLVTVRRLCCVGRDASTLVLGLAAAATARHVQGGPGTHIGVPLVQESGVAVL